MPLEALIFDVDGTLAETEEIHRRAFNAAFAKFGLDWVWPCDLYRDLLRVTGGKERIRHFVEAHAPRQADKALAYLAEIHAAKNALYGELVARGTAVARPGILRLVDEARRHGLRLAIATTTSPVNVEALLLSLFGPAGVTLFEVIGAGDCVAAKKPAPDIYRFVLAALGVTPSRCVAFEDTQNGIAAAQAAGVPVVATPSFYAGEDDFSRASLLVSDLGEPENGCRHLGGAKLAGALIDVAALRRLVDGAAANARSAADMGG